MSHPMIYLICTLQNKNWCEVERSDHSRQQAGTQMLSQAGPLTVCVTTSKWLDVLFFWPALQQHLVKSITRNKNHTLVHNFSFFKRKLVLLQHVFNIYSDLLNLESLGE